MKKRFLNTSALKTLSTDNSGFTLIEVLVAITVLALVMTAVLQLQTQSIEIGAVQQELVMASLLVQNLMSEIELDEYPEVGEVAGDFGEDHPQYAWERIVSETIFDGVNEVRLTVSRQIGERKPREILTISKFLVRPGASVKLRDDFDSGEYVGSEHLEGVQSDYDESEAEKEAEDN